MRLRRQLLTQNECCILGAAMLPKGIMVHSTGANNPRVARYVPGDEEMGRNTAGNHWNQFRPGGRQVCVHAFIGKFADGQVGTVQTLPWTVRGWHCAGTANHSHIGFEICEDGLTDPAYFQAVYWEAAELTAYLCREYGLDPLADGVVICHQEGYRRGVASNHADVLHWFSRHGRTMDAFRADVAQIIKGDDEMLSYEQWKQYMERYRKELSQLPVPGWAGEELEWAKAMGLTDGKRPQDLVTRAEAAVMAARTRER